MFKMCMYKANKGMLLLLCSLVNFKPACSLANQRFQLSISNQRVRLSILNQCVLSSIDTFLKTSDQRIEQITITHLPIAPRIVLECQRCVIKTTDSSQLGQSGGGQYCLFAAFVSSIYFFLLFIYLLQYSTVEYNIPLLWLVPWEKNISPPHSFFQIVSSLGSKNVSCRK